MAEGGQRAQAWPQCMQFVSQQQPQQRLCTQCILDSSPTQPQSATPGTARFFTSSAVAMPNELWLVQKRVAYLMALQKTPTWTASSAKRSWSESSSPLARQRTAAGWKASSERRRGCCSWRPRGGLQDGPRPDPSSSTKKTQWVGWTVNSTECGPMRKRLPEACNADFLLAQETHLPKGCRGRLDSQRWRVCVAPALFRSPQHGEWVSTKQTVRTKGSAGSWLQQRCGMVLRRRTVVLATGASSSAKGVCLRSTTAALCQAGR